MTSLESATRFSGYRVLLICLAGVIGAGLLPTLMMRAMGWSNGFWLIANMWQGQGGGDSWGAIAKALQHLDTQGIDQFYEDLYYRADHQFIYSPLSLVFFRLTQFPPWIDWYSSARMNNASWWVMLAMILVLTLIMRESIVRFVRTAVAPTLPQTAGMVALSAVAISTFFPIISGFRNGQIQTWLDFLAMLSLLLVILDRHCWAGLFIGLACIIKPQVGVMIVWAALRRDWWFLAGALLPISLFGAVSLAEYGWQMHIDYASLLLFLSRRGESFVGNQSINGLLDRMFFLGPNVTFDGSHTHIIYNPWVQAATTLSSAIMILAALFVRSEKNTFAGVLDFGTALLVSTLASPVAYAHHYGWILPLFWLLFLKLQTNGKRQVGLYALLGVSYAMMSNGFGILNNLADTNWNFLQSVLMFGAFILLGLLYWVRIGGKTSRVAIAKVADQVHA